MIMFSFVIFILRIVITIINTRWSSLSFVIVVLLLLSLSLSSSSFPQVSRWDAANRSNLQNNANIEVRRCAFDHNQIDQREWIHDWKIQNYPHEYYYCYLEFSKKIMVIDFTIFKRITNKFQDSFKFIFRIIKIM